MGIIRTAYPAYYRRTSEIEDAVNLWTEMMDNDDPNLIARAVKQFIKSDPVGFPPGIGQIKELAKSIRVADAQDEKMREQQKRLAEPIKVRTPEDELRREEFMEKMRMMLKEI